MQEVEDKKDKKKDDEKSTLKVYEVSFLIVPEIVEEKVPELVSSIKSSIEEAQGLFISEDYPKLRPLAYTMVLSEDNKKRKFDQGYFGWLKFEIEKEKIADIEATFKKDKNILRFLLIETVKENTLYSHKLLAKKAKEKMARKNVEESEKGETKPEEIDKSIEKLVID